MQSLAGPFAVAAGLLVLGRESKARRPDSTVRALGAAGARVPAALVRLFGAAEVAIGISAVLVGGRLPGALVAASYAGFTAFVAVALRRRTPLASCGCFGRPDTPPTATHLAIIAAGTAVAGWAAVDPLPGIPAVLADPTGGGVPLLALVGLGLWLAYLALAVLPTVRGGTVAAMSRLEAP